MPDPSRREFLLSSAAGLVAAAAPDGSPPQATADAVVWINLVGGPSQLDTFDPKPGAPSAVRGPFRPIPTRVPGVQLSELFPKLAAVSDKFSLIRSLHHTAAPVHEAGFQLLQTGRLFGGGPDWPHMGAVVSHLRGDADTFPPRYYVTPEPHVETGLSVGRGFGPAYLADKVRVWQGGIGFPDQPTLDHCHRELTGQSDVEFDDRYGMTPFGQNCFGVMRTLERNRGWRFAVVNQFSTVFDAPSWDCHAADGSLNTTLADYRNTVAPAFDAAFSRLLLDLDDRGLLARTLVVAAGEFGRTPHLNSAGGRDHWPGCWTALVAGGGVTGGRVVGRSDAVAGEPADRPVTPQELVATVYHALGIPPTTLIPGPAGGMVPVVDAAPVRELF